jgi:hypothetical protein
VNRKQRRAAKGPAGKRGEYLRPLPEGCPNPETDLLFPATGIPRARRPAREGPRIRRGIRADPRGRRLRGSIGRQPYLLVDNTFPHFGHPG